MLARTVGGWGPGRFLSPRVGCLLHDEAYLERRVGTNYAQLSPVSLIKHAAMVYPEQLCYVHGAGVVAEKSELSRTWGEVSSRVRNVAHSLRSQYGVKKNDVVSVIAPNTPIMFELHYAVPGCRAVLHSINTRLDAKTIAFQLLHAETKVIFVDSEFDGLVRQTLELLPADKRPVVLGMHDPTAPTATGTTLAKAKDYEDLAAPLPSPPPALEMPDDEWDSIALNYTSGTTGSPKGVLTHHRGAYLNAVQNLVENSLQRHARFLWIVPLFHCNGWNFAWSMAANAGASFFLRAVRPEPLFHILDKYEIDLFCGAPITMLTMLQHHEQLQHANPTTYRRQPYEHKISLITAGAPPPPSLMARFQETFNISVATAYGLTESYGPISSGPRLQSIDSTCIRQSKSSMLEEMAVVDPDTGVPVPIDGISRGEVVLRGNILMKGYFKNPDSTNAEFRHGWYFTGDVGVWHNPGHRVEIKDRSKDVIISGGENVNSIDVEEKLLEHPKVLEAAVVAMPDDKWGEVPAAFVVLRPGAGVGSGSGSGSGSSSGGGSGAHMTTTSIAETAAEIQAWARTKMAGFQTPKKVFVEVELPKTVTGKVQKNVLRDKARLAVK